MKKITTLFFVVFCFQIMKAEDGSAWGLIFYLIESKYFYICFLLSAIYLYYKINTNENKLRHFIPILLVILNQIFLYIDNNNIYEEEMFIANFPYILIMIPYYSYVLFTYLIKVIKSQKNNLNQK